MNREALPLLLGISIPLIFVSVILLYVYKPLFFNEIFSFLMGVNIIYYILVFPIGLGLLAALIKYGKSD